MTLRTPTVYHTVALPFAGLTLLLALGFLRFTAQIETEELRHRLNQLTLRSESQDASDLLLRLEQELKTNATRLTKREIPEAEIRLLTAFPERTAGDAGWFKDENIPVRIYRRLIQLMQRAAGVTPVEYIYIEGEIDLVTLAYNLERRRYFSEALLTFQKAMRPGIEASTRDFILLHSGYNFFFLGEYVSAEKAWKDVAVNPANEANRLLAEKLVAWLARFTERRGKTQLILSKKNRAAEFYRIMAYKDSLETLLQVAEPERDQGYFYLRGRVQEAPGDYEAAVKDYRAAIGKNRNSELAALANRRLYLMGMFYRRHEKLAESAKKAAPGLGDIPFFGLAAPYAENPPLTGQTAKDYAPDEAYSELIKSTAQEITRKKKTVMVRVKTQDGSVITGRQVSATAQLVVIENENGRFRIPTDDIESKEIVSGN